MFVFALCVDCACRFWPVCVRVCMFTIPQSALAHLSLVRSHFSNTVTQIVGGSSDRVCVCACEWVGVCVCVYVGGQASGLHHESHASTLAAPPLQPPSLQLG